MKDEEPLTPVNEPETEPSRPEDFGFSRFALRVWHGMTFGAWMRILWGNFGKVAPARYGLAASVTALSIGNSVQKTVSNLVFGRRLGATQIEPHPVFVLGHWRSGTTWLHQLLTCDDRFAAPTTLQCFNPEGFLTSQALTRLIMRLTLPDRRPMDNVPLTAESSEEDEHALLLGGAATPYRSLAFPCHQLAKTGTWTEAMSPQDAAFWRRTWVGFLRRVQFANPGKQLLLKSPAHTERIPEILSLFPDARFVHIVRDPYKVFLSCLKTNRAMPATQSLQDRMPAGRTAREITLRTFDTFQNRFEATRGMIPEGHMVSIRYEDLRADPETALHWIYGQLGLGDFDTAAPKLTEFLEAGKGYQTNVYDIAPEIEAEVYHRWQPHFERYGYARMCDREGGA